MTKKKKTLLFVSFGLAERKVRADADVQLKS